MIRLFVEDAEHWVKVNSGRSQTLGFGAIVKLYLKNLPVRAVFWFRLSHYFSESRIPLAAGFIRRMLLKTYGLDIPPDARIAGGFYIAHPVGVTVLAERIGARCEIIGGVTIGKRVGDMGPVIGDDVYIGAGARVLGPIVVGDRAKIGANAVVIEDVPAGATVVGVPGKVIRRE